MINNVTTVILKQMCSQLCGLTVEEIKIVEREIK